MEGYGTHFKGKKITVLGLGLLGRGVGDAEFLAKCGADVLVTDRKSEHELASSVERLKQYPNVSFRLGGHHREDFTHADMVLKAAGVRLDSAEVAAAKAAGVPVVMSTALFAKYASEAGVKIVGVTGTRGKSTVSHMIYHVLKHVPRQNSGRERQVFLGGNVRGISTLAMLPEVRSGDIAVLELDSWQLQGFGELHISPHVSVFTNLMPDHQNYYRDTDEYFADKAHIFNYQKTGDTLIIGESVARRVRAANPPVEPIMPDTLASDVMLRVPGVHNRHNAALAAAALLALGLNAQQIRIGLESFEGVEGRLQIVADADGVKIYNDNNATTPEATVAALRALDSGKRNIILIAGGSDKELDISELASEIQTKCKAVYLLAGTGTKRLQAMLADTQTFESLETAFDSAQSAASVGDIILFSPAFASFGMFQNEYERGDLFMKLVSRT
jgi:UDP-N-acetylmuramoylalanine--D-glutamate ligase